VDEGDWMWLAESEKRGILREGFSRKKGGKVSEGPIRARNKGGTEK